jgi:hypothetical protein
MFVQLINHATKIRPMLFTKTFFAEILFYNSSNRDPDRKKISIRQKIFPFQVRKKERTLKTKLKNYVGGNNLM